MKHRRYWCRFCDQQRQLFGKTAWPRVAAVECDPRGVGAKPDRCGAVEAYPTWVVNGKTLTGVQSLANLEAALATASVPGGVAADAANAVVVPAGAAKPARRRGAEECDDCAVAPGTT